MIFGQEEEETIKSPFKNLKYGVQFTEEIELPNKYTVLNSIKLIKLRDKYRKEYYQTDATDDDAMWDLDNIRNLQFKPKSDLKYTVTVLPLKPNSFYKLEISYYGIDNIISIIRMIHDEGKTNWTTEEKKWMQQYNILNTKYEDLMLTYSPRKKDVVKYKLALNVFDLNSLDEPSKLKLVNLTKSSFPNLSFPDIRYTKTSLDETILLYAKYIKSITTELEDENLVMFESYFRCIDYYGIYNLYEQYFKGYFESNKFNSVDYIAYFKESVAFESNKYKGEMEPNYLLIIKNEIKKEQEKISTFPINFATAYKNAIVPDFGYVVFDNFSNNFRGGSPFVGVNISFSPSNKDVPLQISNLDFWQRTAFHTGIILNSITEGKKREDLFSTNSLLIGISYKVFNHAYRINFGGIVYKKIDTISGDKSFAITPYVGVSIDIEIKKWLSEFFPTLK